MNLVHWRRPIGAALIWLSLADSGIGAESDSVVDFAGETAVFELDGRLVTARRDAVLPGLEARLRHVGPDTILLEFPAKGTEEAVIIELRRGSRLAAPRANTQALVPTAAVTARELGKQASPKRSLPASGRGPRGSEP